MRHAQLLLELLQLRSHVDADGVLAVEMQARVDDMRARAIEARLEARDSRLGFFGGGDPA